MYLVGMYVLVNLRNLLDFGIACGVTVVVHLLVCYPKSNVTLRLDISMRFVGSEDVRNISAERKWAQLFLRPDREIFGKKFVRQRNLMVVLIINQAVADLGLDRGGF